jgi:hypothetical protein
MNGIIRGAALLAGFAAVLVAGCCTTGSCPPCGVGPGPDVKNLELYDRCYPERYENLARREVNHAFAPQVMNGHVLDQTVWNTDFEPGTDKLTGGGLAHLQVMARRRPCPDKVVYLATAHDLDYDPNCPDRYCAAKSELDALRKAAVLKYLTAMNCGRGCDYQVLLHDPPDVGLFNAGPSNSVIQMYGRYRGGLPTVAGGPLTATGGGGGR